MEILKNDDVHLILAKAVVIQALYAILENEFQWDIVAVVDDLAGFGKTAILLPKECLNKQEVQKYIQEIKQKKVGDQ